MGVTEEMLMSALLDLHPNSDDFIKRFNSLDITNSIECIEHINTSEKIREDVAAVYNIIADAISSVKEIACFNINDVVTINMMGNIVGCCMLFNEVKADNIVVSPINVGKGIVKYGNGFVPVPTPLTAHILKGIPVYSNEIEGELCTAVSAALLKHFANEFKSMPMLKIKEIGYGMSKGNTEALNCVRVIMGETEDKVTELMCNVDDMTGERIGFAMARIFEAGALDVFTTSIGMKKNRPGILLTCICRENKKEKIVETMFKYTSTIGIRENVLNRYVLNRSEDIIHTKYGDVRVKKSEGYGVVRTKAEYDDLERLALENNIDISKIKLSEN